MDKQLEQALRNDVEIMYALISIMNMILPKGSNNDPFAATEELLREAASNTCKLLGYNEVRYSQ